MACSPCEQRRREREALAAASKEVALLTGTNCGYTISQLTKWKETLDCAYSTSKLESVNLDTMQYQSYIGMIDHTINHIGDSDCTFAVELGIILNAVHVLVALGC